MWKVYLRLIEIWLQICWNWDLVLLNISCEDLKKTKRPSKVKDLRMIQNRSDDQVKWKIYESLIWKLRMDDPMVIEASKWWVLRNMLNPSAASAWCLLEFLYRRGGYDQNWSNNYLLISSLSGRIMQLPTNCVRRQSERTNNLVLSGWYQRAFREKTRMILITTLTKITTFYWSFEEFSCFSGASCRGAAEWS